MEKDSYKILVKKLLYVYSRLHELSVNQQKVLSGQSDIPFHELIEARSILFTEIEQLQKDFLVAEKQEIYEGNQKLYKELQDVRRLFQLSIEKIKKSDEYLEVLVEERKRQITDKIKQIENSRIAEIHYMKMNENKRSGHLFSDTPRFFDQRK